LRFEVGVSDEDSPCGCIREYMAANFLPSSSVATVASWQNSQYSVDLIRSPYGDSFGLMICAKAAAATADLSFAEAVKLEELQRPEKEADEKKKKADALELTREKNRQSFRP
jgi:hypothetical protein